MRFLRPALPIGLIALLLSSCGPSKVAQCNEFADVINQAQGFKSEFESEIDSFTQQAQAAENLEDFQAAANQYIEAVDKVVDNIDGMVNSLEGLNLADEELADYRDRYGEIISSSSEELAVAGEAMQLVANAKSETDLGQVFEEFQSKADNAFTNLQTLSQQESALVGDINTYCGAEAATEPVPETAPAPAD